MIAPFSLSSASTPVTASQSPGALSLLSDGDDSRAGGSAADGHWFHGTVLECRRPRKVAVPGNTVRSWPVVSFSPPADGALPLDRGLFSRYIYFRFFFPFCSRPQTARRNLGMQHRSLFPVIITPALAAARDFYVQHLGFHAVFDS